MKSMIRLLLLSGFVAISALLSAQSKDYKVETTQELFYEADSFQKGAAGNITVKITYDVFFGDATFKALAGRFKPGSYFYYGGKRYLMSILPAAVAEKIKLSSVDVCYDISSGGKTVVTNICKKQLMDFDMAGSPNWSQVFPGLNAQQAKDLYKAGFTITNLRITGVSMNYPSDISKYLNGAGISAPGNNTSSYGSNEVQWEAVRYYRKGDSLFIYHNNNVIEKFRICGTPATSTPGRRPGPTYTGTDLSGINFPPPIYYNQQTGEIYIPGQVDTRNNPPQGGSNNNTSTPAEATPASLLSPYYEGNTIVWGTQLPSGKWKVVKRNATTFSEVSRTDYENMKKESLLTMDKMDGDWDEPSGTFAKGRLSPKYPVKQPVDAGTAPGRFEPDYVKMIVVRVFDGSRYVDGIGQPGKKWLFMESNGFTFSIDETLFKEMISRQRKDVRY